MNSLMHSYCIAGGYEACWSIFQTMLEEGPPPDERTDTIAIMAGKEQGLLEKAEALFEEMQSRGLPVDPFTWNNMIQMFGNVGDLEKAQLWFRQMLELGCKPTVVTFNTLLHLMVKRGMLEEAGLLLDWMLRCGPTPSLSTYALLLMNCTHASSRSEARALFRLMAKIGSEGHEVISLLLTPLWASRPVTDFLSLPQDIHLQGQDPGTLCQQAPVLFSLREEILVPSLSSIRPRSEKNGSLPGLQRQQQPGSTRGKRLRKGSSRGKQWGIYRQ